MKVWLHDLRWPEVEAYLEDNDTILLPLGSTEQHGRHLPLKTDTVEAAEVARAVAERTGVLVAPPLPYGWTPHHMAFPGTLTLRPETLAAVIEDVCQSFIFHGFRKIFILNGHRIFNLPPAETVATRLRNRTGAFICAVDLALVAFLEVKELSESPPGGIGHACEIETSAMLHYAPELVEMEHAEKSMGSQQDKYSFSFLMLDPELEGNRVSIKNTWREFRQGVSLRTGELEPKDRPSGVEGDPTTASAEKGRKVHEVIVRNTVEIVERFRHLPITLHQEVEPPL
ncbi:MAG: creatininase family protein [Nitrospinota bacterium]